MFKDCCVSKLPKLLLSASHPPSSSAWATALKWAKSLTATKTTVRLTTRTIRERSTARISITSSGVYWEMNTGCHKKQTFLCLYTCFLPFQSWICRSFIRSSVLLYIVGVMISRSLTGCEMNIIQVKHRHREMVDIPPLGHLCNWLPRMGDSEEAGEGASWTVAQPPPSIITGTGAGIIELNNKVITTQLSTQPHQI